VIEYPCAKFGDFSFSHFGFIVNIDRQNHTHTHTEADDRYTHATTVGVSMSDFIENGRDMVWRVSPLVHCSILLSSTCSALQKCVSKFNKLQEVTLTAFSFITK